MRITEITLYSTPMQENGIDRYFPDYNREKYIMLSQYNDFLRNNFNKLSISKRTEMAINMGSNFTLELPFNFSELSDFNYAGFEYVSKSDQIEYKYYFFHPINENNSIGSTKCRFTFDYLIDSCDKIYELKDRPVLTERCHTDCVKKYGDRYVIQGSRFLNTYEQPMVENQIEDVDVIWDEQVNGYDILWYDIQVENFRPCVNITTPSGEEWQPVDYTETTQFYSKDFSSTYHIFKPYKVYNKFGRTEISKPIYATLNNGLFMEQDYAIIGGGGEPIIFKETSLRIIDITLTFNPPFNVKIKDGEIVAEAVCSPIYAVGGSTQFPSGYYIFRALGAEEETNGSKEYYEKLLILEHNNDITLPNIDLLTDREILDSSPFMHLTNIGTFNIKYSNTTIPLYSRHLTDTINIRFKYYPKVSGAFVTGNIDNVFNTNSAPLYFVKNGTIPYTISQADAYKIANGNRIKANIIGTIAGGAVTIASIATGNYLGGAVGALNVVNGAVGMLQSPPAQNYLPAPTESVYNQSDFNTISNSKNITLKYSGEKATTIMNTIATFADLKNLVTIAGQSSENAMDDLIYQDRLLITQNVPTSNYDPYLVRFCKEYLEYGGIVNEDIPFMTQFEKQYEFYYVKIAETNLPFNSAFNESLNYDFNNGIRFWRLKNNVGSLTFNTRYFNFSEDII